MSSAFDRLHPHLRHAIVHDLGWTGVRPVQELTIQAVLDGDNVVVLAPTAGGKTEASLFPVLSQILEEERPPVAALYLCPVRALLNNQEARVGKYCRMVGLDAFKWHGDVADSKRGRFRAEPAHVLMTTPESVEVMLLSAKTDARALFRGLRTVIVDEVHAFAGDDRGAHLVALLERLTAFCGVDLQRIGLSATVGNPQEIGEWLQGSSNRPLRLVDPPRPHARRALRIERFDSVEDAAPAIANSALGKKSLVFVESRAGAERVAHSLKGRGVDVFVHHGAISRADRELAEERFERGSNTAIVATSTMELGIDVGDLDQVLQIDAPSTVAGFLQRIGRTGRRAGTVSNCTLFCTTPEALLHAVALLRLADRGWVEDVVPVRRAWHILAHQVLALTLQEGGVSRHRVLGLVGSATPFHGLGAADVNRLVDTMLSREVLHEGDGLLSLGAKGERIFGRRNFSELYVVFHAPPLLKVVHGQVEVGTVDSRFVQGHDAEHGPLCFRLAGRPWRVVRTDLDRGVLQVEPAEAGRIPTWLGQGGFLSFALVQEMKRALREPGAEAAWLAESAAKELQGLRDEYDGLVVDGGAPLEERDGKVYWHTFAGGAINRVLGAALRAAGTGRWVVSNRVLRWDDGSVAVAKDAIARLPTLDLDAIADEEAGHWVRGRLSKFEPCLPEDVVDALMVVRVLDVAGTRRFLQHLGPVGVSVT